MKRYHVRFVSRANLDLVEVYDYIYNMLENPTAANATVREILDKCKSLSRFPMVGAVVTEVNSANVRVVHYKKYSIFYHVDGEVVIRRIIYSRRNIQDLLG